MVMILLAARGQGIHQESKVFIFYYFLLENMEAYSVFPENLFSSILMQDLYFH